MEVKRPYEAIGVLGNPDAVVVLEAMWSGEWKKASDVAREGKVHVATAVKYLASLHDLGIFERKRGRGKTKEVYLYRLPDTEIVIQLRPETKTAEAKGGEAGRTVLKAIKNKAAKTYGPNVKKAVEKAKGPGDAVRILEKELGEDGAAAVVGSAVGGLLASAVDRRTIIDYLKGQRIKYVELE